MTRRRNDGFVAFFRRYTKTSLHTVSTVALTAFGMLTFVNRAFAAVAIAAYVVPPIVQYFRQPDWARAGEGGAGADGVGDANVATEADANGGDARRETPPGGRTPHETTEKGANAAGAGAASTPRSEATAGDRSSDGDDPSETVDGPSKSEESEESTASEPEWVVADAPTEETLFDAAVTKTGAYAAGEDGVVVAEVGDEDGRNERVGDASEWEVVLSDGPGAESNDLTGVDAVDGGGVWVAGESGAVGRINPGSGRHVDFSAPDGDTDDVAAVAVAGSDGTETVLLADGSGRVRRGRYRDGDVAWDDAVKPGSGSSIVGVELRDEEGYVCDSNDCVFRTTDAGRTFESLDFEGANGTLTDVTVGDAPLLSDDDGALHRYDGSRWTPDRLGDDPILAVAAAGPDGVAAGEEAVYERFGSGWKRASPPAVESLSGVALGGDAGNGEPRAVVVGEAGTVLERTAKE